MSNYDRGGVVAIFFALATPLFGVHCKPSKHEAPPPSQSTPTPSASALIEPPKALAPLAGEWLEELRVGERIVGHIALPIGAIDRRPIAIAIHGAGDRSDWACSGWRAMLGPVPFVVCPRGERLSSDRYTFPSTRHLELAIEEALAAAAPRFSAYFHDGPRLFAGFSRGAILGAKFVSKHADKYPNAIFLEGVSDVLRYSFAEGFKRRGGHRVLLACSTLACEKRAEAAREYLTKRGVAVRTCSAGDVGHWATEVVINSVRKEAPWVLQGSTTSEPMPL